jgi:hypothetical protein
LEHVETRLFVTTDRARPREANNGAETLRQVNQRLKNLLITVATIILKSVAEANHRGGGTPSPVDNASLLEKAEECFLAAHSNVGQDAARNLEAAGRALLAGAMELQPSTGHKPAGEDEFPPRTSEY